MDSLARDCERSHGKPVKELVRLYIAGPMTGLPEYNYPAFNEAEKLLLAAGYDVLNPVVNDPGTKMPWDWYMRKSLKQIAVSDGIALLPGWEGSQGAQMEARIGRELGMDVLPLEMWLQQ